MTPTSSSQRTTILKVQVGSHAHGLAGPESDQDFRSVFVIPTTDLFRLDFKYPATSWKKGDGDEASWEIAPFLSLALQSHPLILETFLAPVVKTNDWGKELQTLFPAVWSPQKAFDAFIGYAKNQRTKFLDKKDSRPEKYAAAYVRVLSNLCELLETGTFTVRIRDTPLGESIVRIKQGAYRIGEVIDLGEELTQKASRALHPCPHQHNIQQVEDFLIRIRTAFLP
ncbi:DNA polymerase beta superfamily protein [Candidatus Nitronereus thalassa]|uniref:Nucleotidyltransferase domain-containing protein n=1 Tax=Candidatus Nitronereus thalassa TaxID=3020898 RepID=A0ABU3K8W2_9BACT|nr:nucleotidyltransferase domain-containing protein [Candidatus Nitronereus thalassa]MDT7042802.1 nucleotidyltransferase domain-containing protein [Candidatus Nitronereus thalassa]